MEQLLGTTIIAVKRNGKTVVVGDGQVTFSQNVVMKDNAKKVRRIYNGKVVVGFAGGVADAFSLSGKFEEMLNKYSGNLLRSAVELAISFRSDTTRKLEAMLIVADSERMLIISGNGEVIEPDDICAIGSGGNYALSAGKALLKNTNLEAKDIAIKAMEIASEICIYTNNNFVVEEV